MDATRRFIQTVRSLLGGAVVIYVFVILRIPSSSSTASPAILRALTAVAVIEIIILFALRKFQVLPVEAWLAQQPQDSKALVRLRQGYLVTYSLSLSVALYGLVLHFLGFSVSQVAPFFVAGFMLIALLGPKRISSSTLPPQSGPILPR